MSIEFKVKKLVTFGEICSVIMSTDKGQTANSHGH